MLSSDYHRAAPAAVNYWPVYDSVILSGFNWLPRCHANGYPVQSSAAFLESVERVKMVELMNLFALKAALIPQCCRPHSTSHCSPLWALYCFQLHLSSLYTHAPHFFSSLIECHRAWSPGNNSSIWEERNFDTTVLVFNMEPSVGEFGEKYVKQCHGSEVKKKFTN